MPIDVTCVDCSKHYTLKDELAGKKIRCKACSAVMTVPGKVKKAAKPADDEFPLDDDLFASSESFDDDEEDYDRKAPRKAARAKVPVAKKKKRRSQSGGGFGSAVKRILGVGAGGIMFVISYVVVRALVAGGMASAISSWSISWAPYDIPQAPGCTIEMPRKPASKADRLGSPMIIAEAGTFACGAISEPMDADVRIVFADLAANRMAIQQGVAATMPGATMQGSRITTVSGIPAIEFTVSINGITAIKRAFIAGDRMITLDFLSKKPLPKEMERYFSSFKAPGISSPHIPLATPPMGNPITPPAATPNAVAANNPVTTPAKGNPTVPAAPVVVETPANMLVPDTPVDPNAPATVRRSAWRYVDVPNVLDGQSWNAGVFLKKLGENWVEQRKKAATAYWNETARTAEYIELTRTDRSLVVRLYEDRSEYRPGSSPEFKPLFTGKWE